MTRMFYERWLQSCDRLHAFTASKFEQWANLVYRKSKFVICISVFVFLIFTSGFMFSDIYGQTERIFYPQNSRTFKELNRAEKFFRYYVQSEEFILLSSSENKNVITNRDIFIEALRLHAHITSIEGLNEFCVRDSNATCITTSPLELFNYRADKLDNINETILQNIQHETRLLSNGYNTELNLPRWFGDLRINKTTGYVYADALRVEYSVKFGISRLEYERSKNWESKMLKYLAKEKQLLRRKHITLIYNTVRSDDDSLEQNTEDNLFLIFLSIFSMVLFCAAFMASYKNCVHGHFLVSLSGIFAVTLGIACGFGLTLFIKVPYVGFVGVLPFLVLGVGIDDMFIIIMHLDDLPNHISGAERLGKAMKNAGFSITMTTLTDLIAFVIGSVSVFPAVRIFCVFAFFSLLFAYLMIITLFLAFLSYDIKRKEDGKKDCLPCMNGMNFIDLPPDARISQKIFRIYGNFLMKIPSKVFAVVFGISLLALGLYGTCNTSFRFDYKVVGSESSEYITWLNIIEKHFPAFHQVPVDILLDEKVNYESEELQKAFLSIDNITKNNEFFEDQNWNWMSSFLKWQSHQQINGNQSFYEKLDMFLLQHPIYKIDIVFSESRDSIIASRVHVVTKPSMDWLYRKDAMLSIRKDLQSIQSISFYPVSFLFIYASHLVVIFSSTVTNIAICCIVIFLLTLPYLASPVASILLVFNFACFIIELLGIMYFWRLSLNSITMIVMVMAVGFTVDYSCHVAHAYLKCERSNPEQRMIHSLTSIGSSVLKGGVSTLVGVVVLVLSSSKLFRIFFKMMFSIISLGLLHGLFIFPVLLTIFCRSTGERTNEHIADYKRNHENKSHEDGELLTNGANL